MRPRRIDRDRLQALQREADYLDAQSRAISALRDEIRLDRQSAASEADAAVRYAVATRKLPADTEATDVAAMTPAERKAAGLPEGPFERLADAQAALADVEARQRAHVAESAPLQRLARACREHAANDAGGMVLGVPR